MILYFKKALLACSIVSFSHMALAQQALQDLNCHIDSLFGGNCEQIQEYNQAIDRINSFDDTQEFEWVSGNITAVKYVKSVYDLHRSLVSIDSYAKEDYLYRFQVARAADDGKITIDRARYLIERNTNQIKERKHAGQPATNIPFTCKSESAGGVVTTKCQ